MTSNTFSAKGGGEKLNIIMQCSEGRFDLSLDPSTSLVDTKRAFKKAYPTLGDVNMNAFIISYSGKFCIEESATLKSLGIEGEMPAAFFLVKRKEVAALNPVEPA